MKKDDVKVIKFNSSSYPIKLKKIKCAPKKLYYKGDIGIFNNITFLAVVGSRKATNYGKQVLNYFLPEVAKQDVTIVSGLAYGIDVAAHKITLENGGKAIAVLAGGLDQIYPSEHKNFAEEIINKGGILISEHPPGTPYLRQHFPARNRIISGLSDAVLVVEAKEKSGALITADFAFSQGRKVLAVPGNIFSEQSRGVNGIFKKGAYPVQKPEDFFETLFGSKRCKKDFKSSSKKIIIDGVNLTSDEKGILKYISYSNAVSVDFVIRKTGFSAAKTISIITQMEINGLIEKSDGGYMKPR